MKKILTFLVLFTSIIFGLHSQNKEFKTTHSDSLDILLYKIDIYVDYQNQEIGGNTLLQIVSKIDNLDKISLDLLRLTIDSIMLDGIQATYTYNDTLINILPPSNYNQGDTFYVDVYYHGHPVEDVSGFGGFSFASGYAYSIGVAFIDEPHNYGRVWYPCIDDFVDRAKYDFWITSDSGKVSVCNGILQEIINNGDGTQTYHWYMDDEIPTYLANVSVSNYVAVRDTFNGMLGQIPIDIYVQPGDSMNAVNSFVNIKDIISVFESRFGPYRWDRVGYVSCPLGGGMEHATNISYGDFLINGNLTYEYLYAHELSHHWWGDLVTCREAGEMWLNEGWAVYSEAIYKEGLYSKEAYKQYVRDNHNWVVRAVHIDDGGYMALVGIPGDHTYGSTVYDKGGDVAHTIRGYLGDSLFFKAVKKYLDSLAFHDAVSTQMRDIFSQETGIDMTDFFESWVFTPGFPHFSVDSFFVEQNGSNYDVTVFMQQKLKGRTTYGNSNRIELTFMSSNWEKETDLMIFDGQYGQQTFTLPFIPEAVMVDMEEKISDATTDTYIVVDTTGIFELDSYNTYFTLDVQSINDSALVRVEHNWVAPDSMNNPIPGIRMSTRRYWKIDGIFPQGFYAKGKFKYSKSTTLSSSLGYLDDDLILSPIMDSLTILYRTGPGDDWREVPHSRWGSTVSGDIIVDTLKKGEYTLAWIDSANYINKINNTSDLINVYPNPANNLVNIEIKTDKCSIIQIFNVTGQVVYEKEIGKNENHIKWYPADNKGIFFIKLNGTEINSDIAKLLVL